MNFHEKKPTSYLDRILSILAIVVGFVALYFSWQANQIATRQVTPQVKVLSSDVQYDLISLTEDPKIKEEECRIYSVITNSGGASDAIIEQQVNLSFDSTVLSASSKDAFGVLNNIPDKGILSLASMFYTGGNDTLYKPYFKDGKVDYGIFKEGQEVTFPIKIDPFSTVALYKAIILVINTEVFTEMSLNVSYTLRLASGNVIKTPMVKCKIEKP